MATGLDGERMRTLFHFARGSGLRIADAACCPKFNLRDNDHLLLRRMQKIGKPVFILLESSVAAMLRGLPAGRSTYDNYSSGAATRPRRAK